MTPRTVFALALALATACGGALRNDGFTPDTQPPPVARTPDADAAVEPRDASAGPDARAGDAAAPSRTAADEVRAAARPLVGSPRDYDPLMEWIGPARFVLLGEASHGTHEFYRARAEITRRLVVEGGATAVVIEADWTDVERVDRYVRGDGADADARAALGAFEGKFPAWMWRNVDVAAFVEWLRAHNAALPPGAPRVGVYGMDLYGGDASMDAVVAHLRGADPALAERVRARYACVQRHGDDPGYYASALAAGRAASCQRDVEAALAEVRALPAAGGTDAAAARFRAVENARVAVDAEAYYRVGATTSEWTWNLRDRHMADVIDAVAAHHGRAGAPARVVAWAHNSHMGDARATELGDAGQTTVGQYVTERHGRDAARVGFSTYTGTVTAARAWGVAPERRWVRPGLDGSYERLFHDAGLPAFLLRVGGDAALDARLGSRLERAIGVVYAPATERRSHYFTARIARQFDAIVHVDETRAVEPLERDALWDRGEPVGGGDRAGAGR